MSVEILEFVSLYENESYELDRCLYYVSYKTAILKTKKEAFFIKDSVNWFFYPSMKEAPLGLRSALRVANSILASDKKPIFDKRIEEFKNKRKQEEEEKNLGKNTVREGVYR